MVKSGSVKTQIIDYYDGCYIEFAKLISHLKDNKIDRTSPTTASHSGFNAAEDFAIFYYSDGSILVVEQGKIEAFAKDI